ncbi:MAG TPA: D-glycero-beta-D-manno-heptose 1,7-bisphosphate 7-phosphatase [Burkholderiaceae bacterium]|nr:D-glycero-beta-D-manno-heptose 1,7-bisphosphate 7-phosphatase [Burkholderiaceae bacterium]
MKLVIVDRDGTINDDRDDYVKSPEEWVPVPGSLDAIARLNHAGWHVVIVTNQSGLGRGLFDMAALNGMHLKMMQMLARFGARVDAVFFCPHAPDEQCDCRKPLPGLFLQIADRYSMELQGVPVVGDSLRDLQAGVVVGCEPHLVRTGKAAAMGQAEIEHVLSQVPGTIVHADLSAFADYLLHRERAERGDEDSVPAPLTP